MSRFSTASALALALLSSVPAQAGIRCTAIHEWLSAGGKLEHSESVLKTQMEAADMLALETDMGEHNFSLRGDPRGEEFLVIISQGPEYTQGVVSAAAFTPSGQLRLSKVDGTTVHKIICKR